MLHLLRSCISADVELVRLLRHLKFIQFAVLYYYYYYYFTVVVCVFQTKF